MDWSVKGKTVLFTGASRGMGRFAAIELARLGAEVLVVGHSQARGAAAVEAIRGTGGSARFLRRRPGVGHRVRQVLRQGQGKKEGSSPLSLDPVVQQRIDDAAEAWSSSFLRGQ